MSDELGEIKLSMKFQKKSKGPAAQLRTMPALSSIWGSWQLLQEGFRWLNNYLGQPLKLRNVTTCICLLDIAKYISIVAKYLLISAK